MAKIRWAVAAVLALAATLVPTSPAAAPVNTAKPPYLVATAPGVVVDPILSTGDIVGSYQMSGIPDGLGAYAIDDDDDDDGHRGDDDGDDESFVVVMNHELGRSFPNTPPGVDARISRLEIDRKTRSVHDAEYLFTGLEGFERFCSSTLLLKSGRPFYFTGEEAVPMAGQPPGPAHDGSSIVLDPDTGMWRETAHFGHLQHENVVPLELKKWVFLTSEDDFRPGLPSYLYAYIADSFNRGLRGRDGSLYVWKADNPAKNQNSAVVKGESIPGHFVPIPQDENANSTALKDAAAARDAFRFDRLEDIAVRPDIKGRTYIADTGKAPPGQPAARGRIYQFDIDPRDPTEATLKMILNGDAPDNDDIYNPDNMDASKRVLVIQEDRESAFRDPPFSGGYGRVLVYDFRSKTLRSVARVNTPAPLRPGTWESSGVIDARDVLGKNWWLLDVQAHSTTAPQPGPTLTPNSSQGEDGQLLAIKIPGSHGGEDDD
jgi:Bacterial protein of unknown function (DUF839)